MQYLYKFNTQQEYIDASLGLNIPYIVLIKDSGVIISNGIDEVTSDLPERVATPSITCSSNRITISCDTSLATIYYTTDESVPTLDSSVYSNSFLISENTVVSALAVKYGMIKSEHNSVYCPYVAPTGNVVRYSATSQPSLGNAFPYTLVSHVYDPDTDEGTITFAEDITVVPDVSGNNKLFEYPAYISSLQLPNTITEIGNNAFNQIGQNAANLSLTIPPLTTRIGQNAFGNAKGLKSIVIPNAVTTIEAGAFGYNPNLETVEIGTGCLSIDGNSFYAASNLTSITIHAAVPPTLNEYSLPFDPAGSCPIYVPAASVNAYKTASV